MPTPTDYLKKGALRAIEPAISFLARNNVSPNALTTVGTLLTVAAAVVYATGHIMTAGWIMSATAFFDVVDGGLYCVLRDQSHPPQHLHGRRVPGRNNRDFSGLLHARPRRIARNRCQGWSYAASRAHRTSVRSAGTVRPFLEWLGADEHHHTSYSNGVDHRRATDRVRPSFYAAPRFEANPNRQRSSFPHPHLYDAPDENRGNADLTASAILITTEKAIGQIVLW